MYSKPLALRLCLAVILIAVLASCSSPTPEPTAAPTSVPQPTVNLQPTLGAAQTQAVQTFVANLTQSAPTATKVPPTNTVAPTQAPTATSNQPAATSTATQKPVPSGPTATLPIFCTISSILVNGGSDPVSAGSSLKFTFVLVNTGSTLWTTSDFYLTYWSGARFSGQQKILIPENTGKGSNITMAVAGMTAPSNAGTFRAVWAIVKGFTPYCLMPVTVVVK